MKARNEKNTAHAGVAAENTSNGDSPQAKARTRGQSDAGNICGANNGDEEQPGSSIPRSTDRTGQPKSQEKVENLGKTFPDHDDATPGLKKASARKNEFEKPPEVEVEVEEEEGESVSQFKEKAFPEPMAEEAFYGPLGKAALVMKPILEANVEGAYMQLIVLAGNLIGRVPFIKQAGIHHTNEYTVIVSNKPGEGKGAALYYTKSLLTHIDAPWAIIKADGREFPSGESIITAIRDAKTLKNGTKIGGVLDKRFPIIEEEFASLLAAASRPGNKLSGTLRKLFDSPMVYSIAGKTDPEMVTKSHVSLDAHITKGELLLKQPVVEEVNGFGSRNLWTAVHGINEISRPPDINWKDYSTILNDLRGAVKMFQPTVSSALDMENDGEIELTWSIKGGEEWDARYKSTVKSKLLERRKVHLLKLSLIFAVFDCKTTIEPQHLEAAFAVWEYVERSIKWIFGDKTNHKDADKILWELVRRGTVGMSRKDISIEVFSRNRSSTEIKQALEILLDNKLVRTEPIKTKDSDRPTEWWWAVNPLTRC
jgi:hypothetical protein